jgi:hypothetical protein
VGSFRNLLQNHWANFNVQIEGQIVFKREIITKKYENRVGSFENILLQNY